MPVERMGVEEIMEEAQKILPMSPSPTQNQQTKATPVKTAQTLDAEYSALLAAFKVTAMILAIRLFLFLSLVGSFVLAVIATENNSIQSAWVLFLYAGVTTLPLTFIEIWRGKGG